MYSGAAKLFHLSAQMADVYDGAVAEHIHLAAAEDAGGKQVQCELAVFVYDGVSGVVAALIANDDIIVLREKVNHAALSFIAPVDSHYCTGFHSLPFS